MSIPLLVASLLSFAEGSNAATATTDSNDPVLLFAVQMPNKRKTCTIRRHKDDACNVAQTFIEGKTSNELNIIYSGFFLYPSSCLTFANPPTDLIRTYGTYGTPEYEDCFSPVR